MCIGGESSFSGVRSVEDWWTWSVRFDNEMQMYVCVSVVSHHSVEWGQWKTGGHGQRDLCYTYCQPMITSLSYVLLNTNDILKYVMWYCGRYVALTLISFFISQHFIRLWRRLSHWSHAYFVVVIAHLSAESALDSWRVTSLRRRVQANAPAAVCVCIVVVAHCVCRVDWRMLCLSAESALDIIISLFASKYTL